MTMKNLSDLLVTVDLLKEQAQEWDENLGRCSEFVSAIEMQQHPTRTFITGGLVSADSN